MRSPGCEFGSGGAPPRRSDRVALPLTHTTSIPRVANQDNGSYRTYPAGGPRKLPQAPANPRNARVEETLLTEGSPPIPAQSASAKTGLSRRRSRVRVPSLPLDTLQS